MCYSLWYNAPTMLPADGRQHRGCIILQSVTHSLALLKMGVIIARNMLSCLELLRNKPLFLHLFSVYIIYTNDARSIKYQINIDTPNIIMEFLTDTAGSRCC